MRFGIVKPDFGITGGFELVVRRITAELEKRDYETCLINVDSSDLGTSPYGVDVPPSIWRQEPEYFRYLALVEACTKIDLSEFDLIMSTQPPSFAVDHPNQLSLFYHHLRIYYDLSDVYVNAGFCDEQLHLETQALIREIDNKYLKRVKHFLAPSKEVQGRLQRFSGVDNVALFHAGTLTQPTNNVKHEPQQSTVLCVSRHEFPKRTELFVHAMKLLPHLRGSMVGAGGRLPWVKALDVRLSNTSPREELDEHESWLCSHANFVPQLEPTNSNIKYYEHIGDSELRDLYSSSSCFVAPAYLEDYGLTVIEAMTQGRPVIVCDDGGGLTDFVESGVNGLIVKPTGAAIAEAIEYLCSDLDLAAELGNNARHTAAQYSWERSMTEIEAGIAMVTQ